MTAKGAMRAGISTRLFGALAILAGLSLAGCADIDNALFGGSSDQAESDASATPGAMPAEGNSGSSTNSPSASMPGALPTTGGYSTGGSSTGVSAPVASITPINIEQGSDTGTAVSKTTAGLRADVAGLQDHLTQNAQRLADLRNQGASAATSYHEAKAHITARLQVGTTRGNPELVSEWNVAQSSLDQLSGNINAMNALGTAIAGDSSSAHYALDQIGATFNVSGAVDEDHRQLSVLEDETNQTIVLIDRLLKEVSDDVQRQTAYVANERANLTTLASAIKNGELYGADLGSPMMAASNSYSSSGAVAYSGTPLVVIRFDRPNVDYQQILYAALTQALQTRPGAGFQVVAVSPTRGTIAAVQLAETSAERHAQDVLRTMTDMGVPATRLAVGSATDPSASSSEVRVFVR